MLNAYSIIVISGWLLIVLSVSILCSKLLPTEEELSRKIVHIGTGPIIPLAWWLQIPSHVAIPLAFIITISLIINYKFNLIASIENIERKSFGTIAYGLSITILLIFLWPEYPSAVTAGVLVMAFGDGMASLIGRKINSPNWTLIGQRKSVAGTLTMASVTAIVLCIINQVIGIQLNVVDVIGITFLAVGFEQISPLGLDNITVPIGVALSWQWILIH